jgi:hypothetical protein
MSSFSSAHAVIDDPFLTVRLGLFAEALLVAAAVHLTSAATRSALSSQVPEPYMVCKPHMTCKSLKYCNMYRMKSFTCHKPSGFATVTSVRQELFHPV